ncbi:methionine ABC transporter permease [Clostridium sp. D33t1_170424_F3]|uniref:methionine ABC transporter permease n=1 Tax=Clostridium sp. D33t1_170424_F3 TaxID=2787099 RepID=UPI0018A99F73|nr:methionine ABC transporter permease [Clostridium sp. D33t1_170424_F3]
MWDEAMLWMLLQGIGETLYMTLVSTLFAYVIGLPLGIALVVFAKDGIRPHPVLYKILDVIVNLTRSIPFIILLMAIIPFTRWVVGTTLGSTAAIVPLTLSATPFVARLVESSIQEVDIGVIEASQSMGASTLQIIWKVMLPEARPSLIVNCAIASVTILGYTAMAGIVGAGGLGDIAIRFGYYRYEDEVMFVTVVLIIVVVQILQGIIMNIAKHSDRRK